MIKGINHITLATKNLELSLNFYRDVLGFKAHVKWQCGAYLTLNELWLCLSCDTPSASEDYSHIAFDVSDADFSAMKEKITRSGAVLWKQNKSEGKSLYFLDPDGHKLELHVGSLQSRLEELKAKPYAGLQWL